MDDASTVCETLTGMWFAMRDSSGGDFLHGQICCAEPTMFVAKMFHPDTGRLSHHQVFPVASWFSFQFWTTKALMRKCSDT